MNYMPFNSVDHDRVYKAEDWAWYFSTFISNGVFPAPSDGLQVVAGDGMTIGVRPGYGFINGYAFRNQELYNLTISNADGSLDRIDRVVLRWDLTQRLMELAVLTGSPSKSPTAPALTQVEPLRDLRRCHYSDRREYTDCSVRQLFRAVHREDHRELRQLHDKHRGL